MADLINAVVLGVLASGGARYRLSDCADPDLCSAARIPGSFLFADCLLRRQLRFQKNGPACPERVARRVLAIGPGARAMERAATDLAP